MAVLAEQYESFLESVYVAPLFKLVETLEQGRVQSTSHPPSPFEYSYAGSTVVLSVLLLEAFLNLSRYLTGSQERGVLDYYDQVFPSGVYRDEFTELVVLSEILAHDQRWRGPSTGTEATSVTPDDLPAISAHAFHHAVDLDRQVTRKLGLPIVPTRLTFEHVRRAIKVVAAILQELRKSLQSRSNPQPIGTNDFGRVEYRGGVKSFLAAADLL